MLTDLKSALSVSATKQYSKSWFSFCTFMNKLGLCISPTSDTKILIKSCVVLRYEAICRQSLTTIKSMDCPTQHLHSSFLNSSPALQNKTAPPSAERPFPWACLPNLSKVWQLHSITDMTVNSMHWLSASYTMQLCVVMKSASHLHPNTHCKRMKSLGNGPGENAA